MAEIVQRGDIEVIHCCGLWLDADVTVCPCCGEWTHKPLVSTD